MKLMNPSDFPVHVSLHFPFAISCGPFATSTSSDRIILTAKAQDVSQRTGAHRVGLGGPLVLANRTAALSPNKRTGFVEPVPGRLGPVGRILSAQVLPAGPGLSQLLCPFPQPAHRWNRLRWGLTASSISETGLKRLRIASWGQAGRQALVTYLQLPYDLNCCGEEKKEKQNKRTRPEGGWYWEQRECSASLDIDWTVL